MKKLITLTLVVTITVFTLGIKECNENKLPPTTFANLGTAADGAKRKCTDCAVTNPCTSGGAGAEAQRVQGAWDCTGETPEQKKKRAIAFAKEIVFVFRQVGPIIAAQKLSLKANWDKGADLADKVLAAVEASDATTVADLIAALIPIVNEVVAAFTGNTTVLMILALANIALHYFAKLYTSAQSEIAAGIAAPRVSVLTAFQAERVWGCDYHPDKCAALK